MQVWPKNDLMRKLLKHPVSGNFRAQGPADWPDDSFTARRVRDGDVLLSDPTTAAASESQQSETKAPTKKQR